MGSPPDEHVILAIKAKLNRLGLPDEHVILDGSMVDG